MGNSLQLNANNCNKMLNLFIKLEIVNQIILKIKTKWIREIASFMNYYLETQLRISKTKSAQN